jgi:hypothetical protein
MNTAPLTGLVARMDVGVMIENRSCKLKNRPGAVWSIPGGYVL